jgi:hypothetical protein
MLDSGFSKDSPFPERLEQRQDGAQASDHHEQSEQQTK